MNRVRWNLTVLASIVWLGCSAPPPEPKPEPVVEKKVAPPPLKPKLPTVKIPAPPPIKEGPTVAEVTLSDKPDAVVRQVAAALADNHPEVLWFALPASYQNDVKGLVKLAAEKIDPDIYHLFFHSLRRTVNAAKSQKERLQKHEFLDRLPVNKKALIENWDQLTEICDRLFTSELCSIEEMKKFDPPRFLAGTGADVLKQLSKVGEVAEGFTVGKTLDRLKNTRATLINETGDTAVVSIEAPGEKPTDATFVKIEGKWLPKALVEDWPGWIESARKQIDGFAKADILKNRDQALLIVDSLGGFAESLSKVPDDKQFDAAMRFGMGLLAVALKMPELSPAPGKQTANKEEKKSDAKPQAPKTDAKTPLSPDSKSDAKTKPQADPKAAGKS